MADRRPTQRRPNPLEISSWPDPVDPDVVHVLDPRDGAIVSRGRDYWAAIAVQAIQDPGRTTEWTAAFARAVLGEDGWAEAERIVRAVDQAAAASGISPTSGPIQ